ncbi:MAG: PrsW family glutamic-type intramembrane protease [candidate division SR1 bacterium]|nr:PrsW family glutamic-type intramembrane protease [candidate division SR1 bacterium]
MTGETLSTNKVRGLKISKAIVYKIGITLKVFGLGIIIVGSLFAYNYLLGFIGQQNLVLANIINTQSLLTFILYCTLFVALIMVLFRNRYKTIFKILLIGSLFFIALAYGGLIIGINTLLIYYIVSAYAEEYMKYSAGNNMFLANNEPNPSNLIFFCILIGLGFGAVENILYIVNNLINHENINIISTLIGRGLIGTLIHIVSTGLIAFIVMKTKKGNNIVLPIILGIIGGVGLHSIYNISLQHNATYITIPLVILSFFLMTYLTFQSDIIYKQQQQN